MDAKQTTHEYKCEELVYQTVNNNVDKDVNNSFYLNSY